MANFFKLLFFRIHSGGSSIQIYMERTSDFYIVTIHVCMYMLGIHIYDDILIVCMT